MKNFKLISITFLMSIIISCSKGDDGDGGGSVGDPEFSATINGGTFNNYKAKLGSYNADSSVGLTIMVTDSNNNIIRIFMNGTGGLVSGVVKEIGNVDDDGFATNVTIRDQQAQITYFSTEGSITLTNIKDHPDVESQRLASGSFNIKAGTNTSADVTMTGTFKNLVYTVN